MIAASGNSGGRERFFPAASEHVVAVGSVGDDRRRSEFSTYGDHVALAAPGEDVVGVGRRGYRTSTGTSHAAPFVTGAAALLVARARRRGQAIDAATVRRILTRSAQPSSSPADEVGAGVLDVAGAIAALDREYEHPPPNQQEGARHGHREP
jgi:subtilisin family serine protease